MVAHTCSPSTEAGGSEEFLGQPGLRMTQHWLLQVEMAAVWSSGLTWNRRPWLLVWGGEERSNQRTRQGSDGHEFEGV